MTVVKADVAKCQGYANCVMAAPDVFDLAEEGVVTVLLENIDDSRLKEVGDAVRSCPVAAISIERS